MPNMKLFEKQINQLRDDFQQAVSDAYDGDKSWQYATSRFYRMMAAISMANDPAYEKLEKFPDGMNIREEITKRQEELANDVAVRRTSDAMIRIACRPRSTWENQTYPEMLSIDKIQSNYNEVLKEEREKLAQTTPKYRSGAEGVEPNMAAFGSALENASDRLEKGTLKFLDGTRNLTEAEMKNTGLALTDWMAHVQMANDPQYKDLKAEPDRMKMNDMRNQMDAIKFRDTPAYKELFSPGREDELLQIFCGDPAQRKKGEPKLLPYDRVKKNFDARVKNIEVDLLKKRLNGFFEQASNSKGEERSRAVANIIAINQFVKEKKDPFDEAAVQQLVNKKLRYESFLAVTGGEQLDGVLESRDVDGLARKVTVEQVKYNKKVEEEQARAKAEEELRHAREEHERKNALSDEELAGLGMDIVASRLYNEIGKVAVPLSNAYGDELLSAVENAQLPFSRCSDRNSDNPEAEFKKGVAATRKFFDTKLPDGKTIGQYARENVLLGDNYDRLMGRADVIIEKEMQRQTAAKWIEGYKKEFREHPGQVRAQPGYPASYIARIMAARELSNSTRGKASTLNKELGQQQIEKRAREMMANKNFKEFAETLSKAGYLDKVEAIFTKTHSHGGELDDLFRDHLTMRPAGKMPNDDPTIARWMPTVKQRVEYLQKKAAEALKNNKDVYKEASEITLLRRAAGVQRGGKGLNNRVPILGDNCELDLSKAVESNAESASFKKAFEKANGKKLILSGHGGEMMKKMAGQPQGKELEQAQSEVKKEAAQPQLKAPV